MRSVSGIMLALLLTGTLVPVAYVQRACAIPSARIVWQERMNMPTARGDVFRGQSVVGPKIYVIGGWNGADLDTVEIYNVNTDEWIVGTPLPATLNDGAVQVVDNKLYVIGGSNASVAAVATVWEYDAVLDTWTSKSSMPTGRRSLASASVDGKIYTISGVDTGNWYSAAVEMYDPSTDTWETKSPHPLPRQYLTAEAVNGKIYTFGGNQYSNKMHEYDPILDSWTEKSPTPFYISTPNSVTVGNKIYVLGGSGSANVMMYDSLTDNWEGPLDSVPTERWGALTAQVYGKMYIIGGSGPAGALAINEEGTLSSIPTEPRVITVPDDYAAVQEAINNANDWDTIYVRQGTYIENIVVNRTVSLIGENRSSTIINGNRSGTVIVVTAFNVTIEEFTITNGIRGLELFSSGSVIQNSILANNSAPLYPYYFSGDGIVSHHSSNCVIRDNVIGFNEGTAIEIDSSDRITLDNNTIDSNGGGIHIFDSSVCTLRQNKITGHSSNFGIDGWGLQPYIHEIDSSNTINGKPIFYVISEQDLQIDPVTFPEIGYLALINSTNIAVKDFVFKENYQGILLISTNDSLIENVIMSNNTYGIHSYYSGGNEIVNCIASENYEGMFMRYSRVGNTITNLTAVHNNIGMFIGDCGHIDITKSNISNNKQYGIWLTACYYGGNTIDYNAISNNEYCGVFLSFSPTNLTENTLSGNGIGLFFEYSSGSVISHNSFLNNLPQVRSDSSEAMWDYGYPSGGNYWSDYSGIDSNGDGIGDAPYVVDAYNLDNYPLMSPWTQMVGDLNLDGEVTLADLTLLASAYNSKPGDPNWNPLADIAPPYGVISLTDLVTMAMHYGQHYP